MHLSMMNWMRAESPEISIRRLKKYGYESIEISGEPEIYNTKDLRKTLKDYGIRCWGAVTLMSKDRNLLSKNEAQRESSVKYAKDCVTLAKELDGYELTIVPGTVGKINPDATPEEEWEWAVESLKEVYTFALRAGIKIAVEPLIRYESYFCSRAAQAIALANAVGPECGICLDAFHLNVEEADPYAAIRSAKGLLVDFHVADNNRMPPGMGHWDWLKLVGTLKVIGYDGALTAEFVVPIDRMPVNQFPNAIEKYPVDISPEQQKYIKEHGSNILTEEFYDWLVAKTSETLLPLIK